MLTLSAYAKINLALEITGKRSDGYHEIVSVLQTINLADVFTFEAAKDVRFTSHDSSVDKVELLEQTMLNTVELIQRETGCYEGVLIRLEHMGIPRAAGLGSSSSGPAAVIKGLNQLWSLGLSTDDLMRLAARIGSDAPFFIQGSTALARGRGETIIPLSPLPTTWLVLVLPAIDPIPDKTARMYGMLNLTHFTSGEITQRLVDELRQGDILNSRMLYNTFESVAYDFFGQLERYRKRFLAAGADRVHVAGSGPMLFTLVPDGEYGDAIANRLRTEGLPAIVTHTI